MMQGLGLFVVIAILMAVGATTLQCRTLQYVHTMEVVVDRPLDSIPSPVRSVPRLSDPRAVLVLDVSASMRGSDPHHLQTEAVRQFYRIYGQLSREVLRPGEQARLAIVLFSTIAQTIDWTGRGEPWLPISESNDAVFEQVVAKYLGAVGNEPRTGQDTDYLAAIDRVNRLVSSLSSPPAIVFLTDGVYDLHPLFSPFLSAEAKAGWVNALSDRARPAALRVMAGEQDFLSALTLPGGFDTRSLGAQTMTLPADLDPAVRRAIAEARGRLLSRRYRTPAEESDHGPLWAPLFLGTSASAVSSARELLAPISSGEEAADSLFSEVKDPRDLVGEFIAVLSHWFRLREIEFAVSAPDVSVPEDVAAFAVNFRTTGAGSYFRLKQGDEAVSLSGRDGAWAGVLVRGGKWRIQTDGGGISAGRVFLRPRREWIILAPRTAILRTGLETLPIELRLVGIENADPISTLALTATLPKAVSIRLRGRKGDARMELTWVNSSPAPSYRGDVSLAEFGIGELQVLVDVSPLASSELPVLSDHLESRAFVEPGLDVIVMTSDGRRTLPNLQGVPRESGRIRQLMDTWLPHFLRPGERQ